MKLRKRDKASDASPGGAALGTLRDKSVMYLDPLEKSIAPTVWIRVSALVLEVKIPIKIQKFPCIGILCRLHPTEVRVTFLPSWLISTRIYYLPAIYLIAAYAHQQCVAAIYFLNISYLTLRTGLLTTLPEPLSRGGKPVCWVKILPLTGVVLLRATVAVEFLRLALV